jgi:predicted ester cyclase
MKKLCMILPLALILCFMVGCQDKEAMAELEAMKAQAAVEEQNKALIVRWFTEGDKGKEQSLALIDELIANGYVCHFASSEIIGPEGMKEHVNQASLAFSNMQHIIKDNLAKGNIVTTRCIFRTIHSGDFMGISGTGNQLEIPIVYIHRIEDGKIKECWIDWDSLLTLTMQLGMELKPKEE